MTELPQSTRSPQCRTPVRLECRTGVRQLEAGPEGLHVRNLSGLVSALLDSDSGDPVVRGEYGPDYNDPAFVWGVDEHSVPHVDAVVAGHGDDVAWDSGGWVNSGSAGVYSADGVWEGDPELGVDEQDEP